VTVFNPLDAKLNPICHLLALLGAHHILDVSRIRVKESVGFVSLNPLTRVRSNKYVVHCTSKFC